MRKWLPILMLFVSVGSAVCFGQTEHTSVYRRRVSLFHAPKAPNLSLDRFASSCGLSLRSVQSRKAFSNGGEWSVVADLSEAAKNANSDFANAAEVWKVRSQFVVQITNLVLDVGSEDLNLYCFDSKGILHAHEALHMQFPQTEGTPWGLHVQWRLRKDGKLTESIPSEFIGVNEKPIAPPKLDADMQRFSDQWRKNSSALIALSDLKLPSRLLD